VGTRRQINTLQGLEWAVKRKKAVVVPESMAWRKPMPAAVLINLQGAQLLKLFDIGMYVYKKA